MKFLHVAILSVLYACGSTEPRAANRLSPSGASDPVSITRSTRSLVAPTRQFVAYVPAAQRLSVIDQESEAEAYGVDNPGDVRATFPVSKFDGIAALKNDRLTIFSAGLNRSFPLSYTGGDWDAATDAPAFAFSSPDGVRIIRYLDGDRWQDEILAGPASDGSEAPVMNADGTLLVTIRPDSGSYAVYRADQLSFSMTLRLNCSYPMPLSSPIVALAITGTRILWGDTLGHVGVVDVSAATCQQIVPSATFLRGTEVTRIIPRSDASILVFTRGGRVFSWDGDQTVSAYAVLESCDFPLSPTPMGDKDIAVLCLNDLEPSTNTRTILYRSATYNFFPDGQNTPSFRFEFTLADAAALGVDAVAKRFFVLSTSALGRLTAVDLPTGRMRESRGLFVKNLLRP